MAGQLRPARPVLTRSYARESVYAKEQPEYLPLPAVRGSGGLVTTRWTIGWRDRLKLLLWGSLYVQTLTFNRRLQPIKLLVDEPTPDECWLPPEDLR